jgi:integral membrane protein (TIGR01906 family)
MNAIGTTLESAPALRQAIAWAVALLVPVALILTAVRLLMTPAFVRIEYSTPGFPADPFGFTKEDRLYWSQIAVDYLINNEGISFLGDLRFADGQTVYNERELRHMVDVKNTVKGALTVWYVSLGLLLVLGIGAAVSRNGEAFRLGLARGGLMTVLLLAAIILFVLLAFGILFVAFHNVFFAPGTWTFLYSDTLIRLFPERFWRDTFIAIGLLAGGAGLALWYFLKR